MDEALKQLPLSNGYVIELMGLACGDTTNQKCWEPLFYVKMVLAWACHILCHCK